MEENMEQEVIVQQELYSILFPNVTVKDVDINISPYSITIYTESMQDALLIWNELMLHPSYQFDVVNQNGEVKATYDTRIFRAMQAQPYEDRIIVTVSFAPDISEEYNALSEEYRAVLKYFDQWSVQTDYAIGDLVVYDDTLYRCIQAHTSQDDWKPDVAASLWSKASDPTEEWPAWVQPTGAHDAYHKGAKVSHNDKHWMSDIDGNVYEPPTQWTEVDA